MPYFFVDTTVSHALLFTHRSNTPAAPLLKNQIAMHAPAITPKSEGEPRKTAAATDKARKKPEWVRTLQVRWLTSNALTRMA